MLKIKMWLAAAIIAAGSTAALAQAGGAGAGAGGAGGAAGAAGGAGSGGGAGGEPARPSDPNAPGAIYRGGSGATTTTRRGDDMAPMRTAPTGYTTAPSSRLKSYSERRGRARSYSQ